MRYKFLRFPDGKYKAITFSYDDGCEDDIKFVQLLSKYGLKGTFNLNGEQLRQVNISREEAEEYFFSKGHEIAVHGLKHRANGFLRPIEGINEVLQCRLELEKRFGRIIRGMAYPDTGITRFSCAADYDRVKQYLTELDIAYSRTLGGDNDRFELPSDWHSWMPTAHHNNPNIFSYLDSFLAFNDSDPVYPPTRNPKLFYIWGHSYEFDMNNNWDHIEAICQKVSGRDDIWYATNIEIYDYVKAYESLVYSADERIVYNPTVKTIWFDIDGKQYKICPDETLVIE